MKRCTSFIGILLVVGCSNQSTPRPKAAARGAAVPVVADVMIVDGKRFAVFYACAGDGVATPAIAVWPLEEVNGITEK